MNASGMNSSTTSTTRELPIVDFLNGFHSQYDGHLRSVLQNNRNKINDKGFKVLHPSKIGANGRKKRGKSKQGKSYFSRPSSFNALLQPSLHGLTSAYLDFDDEESEEEKVTALNNVEQRAQNLRKMIPRKKKVIYRIKSSKKGDKVRTRKTMNTVTLIPTPHLSEGVPEYRFVAPANINTTPLRESKELTQPREFASEKDLDLFTLHQKVDATQSTNERVQRHFEHISSDLASQMETQEEDRLITTIMEVYAGADNKSEIIQTIAKHIQQRRNDENITLQQIQEGIEHKLQEMAKSDSDPRLAAINRKGNQFSIQDAWKTFDSLFCIKCKVYDCHRHSHQRPLQPRVIVEIVDRDRVHALLGKMLELQTVQHMVCSVDCYKTPSQDHLVNPDDSPWSEDENILLLRSIQVLGEELQQAVGAVDPFCALAAPAVISCAVPRTCRQVKEHLVRWFREHQPSADTSNATTQDQSATATTTLTSSENTSENASAPEATLTTDGPGDNTLVATTQAGDGDAVMEEEKKKEEAQQYAKLESNEMVVDESVSHLPHDYVPCKCVSHASGSVDAEGNLQEKSACEDSSCSCTLTLNYCTKWCSDAQCSNMVNGVQYNHCKMFFAGCQCMNACHISECPCLQHGHECDPNVCVSCDSLHIHCPNRSLQRSQGKKVAVVRVWSKCSLNEHDTEPLAKNKYVSMLMEKCLQGDLICELTGELLSRQELSRREILRGSSNIPTCDLTRESVIDQYYMSDARARYLRTSSDSLSSNVELREMYVCGDYRLGVYAKQDIPSCTELVLDVSQENNRYVKLASLYKSQPSVPPDEEMVEDKPNKRKKNAPKKLDIVTTVVPEEGVSAEDEAMNNIVVSQD